MKGFTRVRSHKMKETNTFLHLGANSGIKQNFFLLSIEIMDEPSELIPDISGRFTHPASDPLKSRNIPYDYLIRLLKIIRYIKAINI